MNKKGFEWTLGKLLTLILAVVVMVLILYGISTGGFTPLIEKTEHLINEALIRFGLKDSFETIYDCGYKTLERFSSNALLLEALELTDEQKKQVKFRACKGECKLTGTGIGDYRIGEEGDYSKENFDRWGINTLGEPGWISEERYLIEQNLDLAKFYWQLYNKAIDEIESEGISLKIEDSYNTGIILKLKPVGGGEKSLIALWYLGEWHLYYNLEEDHSIKTTKGVVDFFKDKAHDAVVDDDVLIWERIIDPKEVGPSVDRIGYGKGIGFITGESNDQLDEKKDVEKMNEYLLKRIEILSKEGSSYEEKANELKGAIEGKGLSVEGVDYVMGLEVKEYQGSVPSRIVRLNGSKELDFGLVFDHRTIDFIGKTTGTSHRNGTPIYKWKIQLRDVPLRLVRYKQEGAFSMTNVGNQEDYKLLEEDFKSFKKRRAIRDFLIDSCRSK